MAAQLPIPQFLTATFGAVGPTRPMVIPHFVSFEAGVEAFTSPSPVILTQRVKQTHKKFTD